MLENKLIEYEKFKKEKDLIQKKRKKEDAVDNIEKMTELCEKVYNYITQEEMTNDKENYSDESKDKEELMKKLSYENKILNKKLNNSIPYTIIIFIIFSSIILAIFATLFVISIIKKIIIIDPIYALLLIIGAIGMLITSVASIKDWRSFIKNV